MNATPTKRVVVTDHNFADVSFERNLAEGLDAEFAEFSCRAAGDVEDAIAGADVVLVGLAPVTATALRGVNPGGTLVRYGVGYDNVDVVAAAELGLAVANVPDYGADTVADHATACLLALLRKLPAYDRAIRADGWVAPAGLGPIRGLASTTVGLIGSGRIGRGVAERLSAFGVRVLVHDPFVDLGAVPGITPVDLDELLTNCDAISLHCPLVPATHHLLNPATFARMRPGTVVVNTSRGGLIDPQALVEALGTGNVGAAALDVFEEEPLSALSPLRQQDGILLTPHAAFYSTDAVAALQRLAAQEVGRALRGEPLRCRVG